MPLMAVRGVSKSVQDASGTLTILRDIDFTVEPRETLAIVGASGSGKSTLIVDTLYQALSKILMGTSDKIGKFSSISGFENLSAIELVDQSPIGKSSRSNPITFIKGYDEIRALFWRRDNDHVIFVMAILKCS